MIDHDMEAFLIKFGVFVFMVIVLVVAVYKLFFEGGG